MKETKFRKKELLPAAFIQQNLTKMENLLKEGADLSEIRPEHMAKIIKHEEYIMKILNIEEIRKKKFHDNTRNVYCQRFRKDQFFLIIHQQIFLRSVIL